MIYQFVYLIFFFSEGAPLPYNLVPQILSGSAAWPENFPLETETISRQHWLHSEDTVQPL